MSAAVPCTKVTYPKTTVMFPPSGWDSYHWDQLTLVHHRSAYGASLTHPHHDRGSLQAVLCSYTFTAEAQSGQYYPVGRTAVHPSHT